MMTETMPSVRFHETGGPEVLRLDRVPVPAPGPGEVLIEVAAAGVNFADTIRRGGLPYPAPTPLPFNPGCEVAGKVIACGAGVDACNVGARVLAVSTEGGGYAAYKVAALEHILPWPDGIEAGQALALLVQGLTAELALKEVGRLAEGEVVFIPGATGGVGSLAVQIARDAGAGLIIAGVGSAAKKEQAIALGADTAVDYSQAGWAAACMAATGGSGIDVFLDASAGSLLRQGCLCLAPGGRAVVYGTQAPEPDAVPVGALIGKSASVHGFFLEELRRKHPELLRRALRNLGRKVRSGRIDAHVHASLPLSAAAEAHRILEARETRGKLVLVPRLEEADDA